MPIKLTFGTEEYILYSGFTPSVWGMAMRPVLQRVGDA